MPLSHLYSPYATELLAIKEALSWCFNTGNNEGEISTDSKMACTLIADSSPFLGLECFLVDEVRLMLQSSPLLSCTFSPRA